MQVQRTIAHLVQWMKAYALAQQRNGFVIGVSGGVDSAVVSALCARTGLATLALSIPIAQGRAEAQRAQAHLNALMRRYANVSGTVLDLTPQFTALSAQLGEVDRSGDTELSLVNLKSRLRLSVLYYYAGLHQRLVVGTSNAVEHAVGFFAKYGDSSMDLNPIGALTKSEVYAVAQALGVNARIRQADPTDGLWADGRTDRDQLKAGYGELEQAMDLREGALDTDALELTEREREVLAIYDARHAENEHKLKQAPVCPIPLSYRMPPAKRTGH